MTIIIFGLGMILGGSMDKFFIKETEKILNNLKYLDVFVEEKKHLKEAILNEDKGAIQSIASDLENLSKSYNIGRTVENEVINRDQMICKIDMEIYRQLEYDRIVRAAVDKMSKEERKIYIYLYVDKLDNEEIMKKIYCSKSTLLNKKKSILKKLAIALFGRDALSVMSVKEKAEILVKFSLEYMKKNENLDIKGALYLAEMKLKKQGIEVE